MGVAYFAVARVGELAPGAMKAVEMGGRRLVIAHVGGEYFAFARECPHEAADLSLGELEGSRVRCRNHGYCFDLRTGSCELPPGGPPLTTLPVERRGDEICLRLEW